MSPDHVVQGQVVAADDDPGEQTRPQQTFLHKVASGPAGPDGSSTGTPPPVAGQDGPEAAGDAYDNADDSTQVLTAAVPAWPGAAASNGTYSGGAYGTGTTAAYDAAGYETGTADQTGTADDMSAAGAGTGPAWQAAPEPAGSGGGQPLLGAAAGRVREQWRQVQGSFVDDPHACVVAAAGVVADAAAMLESMLREQQRSLRASADGDAATEQARQSILMYRALLDKLVS